jgi:hypothetical protein
MNSVSGPGGRIDKTDLAEWMCQGRLERKLVWPMLKARKGGSDPGNRLLASNTHVSMGNRGSKNKCFKMQR